MPERKGRGSVERRFGQAVEVFEKAVKAMGRKDFDRARELLGTVLEEYGEEQDVAERAPRPSRTSCSTGSSSTIGASSPRR
jgi:hypothetical protein